MSGFKGHITFGIIFVVILGLILLKFKLIPYSLPLYLIGFFFVIFYSILPDIDIKTSISYFIISTILLIVILVSFILKLWVYGIISTIVMIVLQFLKHRGITHTILSAFILSLPLIFIHWVIALFSFLAYLSHLILDRIT